jgi:hypothetical protein
MKKLSFFLIFAVSFLILSSSANALSLQDLLNYFTSIFKPGGGIRGGIIPPPTTTTFTVWLSGSISDSYNSTNALAGSVTFDGTSYSFNKGLFAKVNTTEGSHSISTSQSGFNHWMIFYGKSDGTWQYNATLFNYFANRFASSTTFSPPAPPAGYNSYVVFYVAPTPSSTTTSSSSTTTTTLKQCVYGTASASAPVNYGIFKIYATQGVNGVSAMIVIKNSAGTTVESKTINQGSYWDFSSASLRVTIFKVMALPDYSIIGVDLSASPIGIKCESPTTTTTIKPTTTTTIPNVTTTTKPITTSTIPTTTTTIASKIVVRTNKPSYNYGEILYWNVTGLTPNAVISMSIPDASIGFAPDNVADSTGFVSASFTPSDYLQPGNHTLRATLKSNSSQYGEAKFILTSPCVTPALPTTIYSTSHFDWVIRKAQVYCDYLNHKQDVEAFYPMPELLFTWYTTNLGGADKINFKITFVLDTPGGGYASGHEFGIADDAFWNVKNNLKGWWAYQLMAHEFGNLYTGNILSGGWPCDWWADHGACPSVPGVESPAPMSFSNVALQQINWQSSTQVSQDVYNENKNDVLFLMFRDKLIGKYGIGMFKTAFNAARQDLMDWTKIDSGKNPSGLLTNYVAAYLTIGANTDLSPLFSNYSNQPYPSGMIGFDGKVMNDIIAARNLIYNAISQGKDVTAAWNDYRNGNYQKVANDISTTTTTTIPSNRCSWGISYSPASGASNGLITKGSKIRVSYLPLNTEYYTAGQKIISPNKYFELGFLSWDANQTKAKVYFGRNSAGAIDGVVKDIIVPSTASVSLGSVFQNNGLMTNSYYSNLKNSTFAWKSNIYNYHEQVNISSVSMSRDPYMSMINGTTKMIVGTSANIKYEYVFDQDLNFGGSITAPEYTNPVKIKVMDKDFLIVGAGTTSIEVLQGSIGTAAANSSVDYGGYKFYATIGSTNSMQIDVKDSSGKAVETLLFTGITSGTAATKITTKTSPLLDVTIISFATLTDGTVMYCNLVIGPVGTTIKEFDTTADVEAAGAANDCFIETPQTQTCTDSDGGMNYYVKGTCTSCSSGNQVGSCSTITDSCSGNVLSECYCNGNNIASINYLCPSGCINGACISGNVSINSFTCSAIGYLKAQCNLSISGLDSAKKYFVYVAGNSKGGDKPATGATIISGSDSPVTVIVLGLSGDTYQLGAWVFEGTNPDVMKPSLNFWSGNPIEVQMKSPITTTTMSSTTTTSSSTTTTTIPPWLYRRPVTISNSLSALTNYQVLVTADTAPLISAGKMRSDCGDVRFRDSSGTVNLNYWIESGCNSASTKFWINVSTVPSGSSTIYMYYGNSSASSESNRKNTFIFFDDFSTVDPGWTNANINNGVLKVGGSVNNGATHSLTGAQPGQVYIEYDYSFGATGNQGTSYGQASVNSFGNNFLRPHRQYSALYLDGDYTNPKLTISGINWGTGVVHKVKTWWWGGGTNQFMMGVDSTTATGTLSTSGANVNYLQFSIDNIAWGPSSIDNILVRKYVSPEPTTSIGAEQIL